LSNDGENIRSMISQMKEFYQQISLLLKTVDTQLKKEKWVNPNNTAIADSSKHIDYPSYWLPAEIFRFYLNMEENPKRLGFVSALVDDDKHGNYEIKEPLVTGGCFDYETEKKQTDDEDYYRYSKFYGYLSKKYDLKTNGEIFSFKKDMVDPEFQGEFENGQIFAIPLVTLLDEKDVKSKMTDPLMSILRSKR